MKRTEELFIKAASKIEKMQENLNDANTLDNDLYKYILDILNKRSRFYIKIVAPLALITVLALVNMVFGTRLSEDPNSTIVISSLVLLLVLIIGVWCLFTTRQYRYRYQHMRHNDFKWYIGNVSSSSDLFIGDNSKVPNLSYINVDNIFSATELLYNDGKVKVNSPVVVVKIEQKYYIGAIDKWFKKRTAMESV